MDNNVISMLLSAGVIAALITGIFSLVIAISNNKKVKDLEIIKQRFFFTQGKYNVLTDVYNEATSQKSMLHDVDINPRMTKEEFGKAVTNAVIASQNRYEWLKEQYLKTCIYLDADDKTAIENKIDIIDKKHQS